MTGATVRYANDHVHGSAVRATAEEDDDGGATTFPSIEAMPHLKAMGMAEGATLAAGQVDALLAEVDQSESRCVDGRW